MAMKIRRLGSDIMNPTVVKACGMATNAASLIILLTLFIWTAKSSLFELEGKPLRPLSLGVDHCLQALLH